MNLKSNSKRVFKIQVKKKDSSTKKFNFKSNSNEGNVTIKIDDDSGSIKEVDVIMAKEEETKKEKNHKASPLFTSNYEYTNLIHD